MTSLLTAVVWAMVESLWILVQSVYQRYRMTLGLVILLVAWYELQVLTAVWFDSGITEIRYWFKLSITDGVNPGWVLAGISHRFPPHYGHLGRNVLFLAVFGAAVERHITRCQYLLFFVGVGFVSLFGEVLYWLTVGKTAYLMGASGSVFGLGTFYCYHFVRHHDQCISTNPEGWSLSGWWVVIRSVFVILFPILVILMLVGQFGGIISSGQSAVLAHLLGACLGLVFDYAVSTGGGRPILCSVNVR